jgi:vacuolar protein sorting-associated protein 13A/C
MFESLVAGLLEKYVGKYVQNWDSKNLKLSVFSGKVVLRNLLLTPNALDELDLPLSVTSGFVGTTLSLWMGIHV